MKMKYSPLVVETPAAPLLLGKTPAAIAALNKKKNAGLAGKIIEFDRNHSN